MDISTNSISNTISKENEYEEMSMFRASLEDAADRLADGIKPEAISNEKIRKGDEILETYLVTSDAIHGGMGSVWRVHHKTWNADLAMKRPQPKFFAEGSGKRKEDFIAECENWINLGLHPNVVSCYYVRDIGGVPSIFSEWMDGGSLKDRIRDGSLYEGPAEEVQERILDIAIQAARGLQYSHENNLIHQDVKPGNLLLTRNWDVKVADFGLAKAETKLGDRQNASGYTPEYCPEEQALGRAAEVWMDIYAWALTILEMYASKRLWKLGSEAVGNNPSYFSPCRIAIPEAMQSVLRSCLTEKPNDFAQIEKKLLDIYKEVSHKEYRRAKSKAKDTADMLNNRALSFLDLGMEKEAEECWAKALEAAPDNLPTIYNQSLYHWRTGESGYEELVRRCDLIQDGTEFSQRWREQADREQDDVRPEILHTHETRWEGPAVKASAEIDPTGQRIYYYSDDFICYDAATLEEIFKEDGIDKLHFIDHQSYAVSSSGEVVDINTGEVFFKLEKFGYLAGILPDGEYCYAVGSDRYNSLYKYNLKTGKIDEEGSFILTEEDRKAAMIAFRSKHWGYVDQSGYNWIKYIVPSKDGKLLYAAGHTENAIAVYNTKTREALQRTRFYGGNSWHHDICLSLDETVLYSGGDSGLCVCPASDINNMKRVTDTAVYAMRITEDGKKLYFCGIDGVYSYNEQDGVRHLLKTESPVHIILLSKDEKRLLSSDERYNIKLWDLKTNQCIRTFHGHEHRITSLSAADDFSIIVSNDELDNVFVWDTALDVRRAPWELSRFRSYDAEISRQKGSAQIRDQIRSRINDREIEEALALLRKGEKEYDRSDFLDLRRELSTMCRHGALCDVYEAGVNAAKEPGLTNALRVIAEPAGMGYAVRRDYGDTVTVCDETGRIRQTFECPGRAPVKGFCYSRSGKLLLIGTEKKVTVWDTEKKEQVNEIPLKLKESIGYILHIAISPNEKEFLCTDGHRMYLWDIQTGKLLKEVMPKNFRKKVLSSLCYSPSGKYALILVSNRTVGLMDIKSGKSRRLTDVFPCNGYLHLSPDATRLYVRCEEEIFVIDTKTWKIIRKLKCENNRSEFGDDLSPSPDGTMLAARSKEGVKLWSLPEMKLIWQAEEIKTKVGVEDGLAFSRDGCLLHVSMPDQVHTFVLERELTFPGWCDWDEKADFLLDQFMETYDQIDESVTQLFLQELKRCGFGYIRPEKAIGKIKSAKKKFSLFGSKRFI